MESGEIKVEIDMAVDPFFIPQSELQIYKKILIWQKTLQVPEKYIFVKSIWNIFTFLYNLDLAEAQGW